MARPRVRRRARAAVFSTGDESVGPADAPDPGRLRDANGAGLAAAVREAGGEPILGRILPDRMRSVAAGLRRAVKAGADLILTSGGVSQDSSALTVLTAANALLVVPPGVRELPQGGPVRGWFHDRRSAA